MTNRHFNCGRVRSTEAKYKNMMKHIRFDVSLEFLTSFSYDKIKMLNYAIRKNFQDFTTDDYINYIERFHNCPQFNKIFNLWIESGRSKWAKPSLDHIQPTSRGGDNSLANLQFITWFENRMKNAMNAEEWLEFKERTKLECDYFG